ncbi:protease HtpX-like protein [Planoprotostelium fungivorum]|uniref:Protease HtpX-like protein n=1 Tax=Planoprotostelium fungivorum TaxID=1890364 RepID=A0A2P6MYH6_9EUKA|nr:protease HtpX-like protein [Planoprotostelium fungivorum]
MQRLVLRSNTVCRVHLHTAGVYQPRIKQLNPLCLKRFHGSHSTVDPTSGKDTPFTELRHDIRQRSRFAKLGYWAGFGALTGGTSLAIELALRNFAEVSDLGYSFFGVSALAAATTWFSLWSSGGKKIAEGMNGRLIVPGSGEGGNLIAPPMFYDTKHFTTLPKESDCFQCEETTSVFPSSSFISVVCTEDGWQLSREANLKSIPTIYWIPAKEMNAFAAGITHRDSVVAVTTGIAEVLTPGELYAVLAHEIGHLANQDSRTAMHLIAINAGYFAIFRIGLNMLSANRRGNAREGNKHAVAYVLMAAGALSSLLGLLYKQAVTRSREYAADACSLAFTGDHRELASALRKISQQHPSTQKDSPLSLPGNQMMFSHMYINNTSSAFSMGMPSFLMKLLSTHPATEDRIARLEQLNQKTLSGAEQYLIIAAYQILFINLGGHNKALPPFFEKRQTEILRMDGEGVTHNMEGGHELEGTGDQKLPNSSLSRPQENFGRLHLWRRQEILEAARHLNWLSLPPDSLNVFIIDQSRRVDTKKKWAMGEDEHWPQPSQDADASEHILYMCERFEGNAIRELEQLTRAFSTALSSNKELEASYWMNRLYLLEGSPGLRIKHPFLVGTIEEVLRVVHPTFQVNSVHHLIWAILTEHAGKVSEPFRTHLFSQMGRWLRLSDDHKRSTHRAKRIPLLLCLMTICRLQQKKRDGDGQYGYHYQSEMDLVWLWILSYFPDALREEHDALFESLVEVCKRQYHNYLEGETKEDTSLTKESREGLVSATKTIIELQETLERATKLGEKIAASCGQTRKLDIKPLTVEEWNTVRTALAEDDDAACTLEPCDAADRRKRKILDGEESDDSSSNKKVATLSNHSRPSTNDTPVTFADSLSTERKKSVMLAISPITPDTGYFNLYFTSQSRKALWFPTDPTFIRYLPEGSFEKGDGFLGPWGEERRAYAFVTKHMMLKIMGACHLNDVKDKLCQHGKMVYVHVRNFSHVPPEQWEMTKQFGKNPMPTPRSMGLTPVRDMNAKDMEAYFRRAIWDIILVWMLTGKLGADDLFLTSEGRPLILNMDYNHMSSTNKIVGTAFWTNSVLLYRQPHPRMTAVMAKIALEMKDEITMKMHKITDEVKDEHSALYTFVYVFKVFSFRSQVLTMIEMMRTCLKSLNQELVDKLEEAAARAPTKQRTEDVLNVRRLLSAILRNAIRLVVERNRSTAL